jgi:translation initiation factor 5B
MERNHEAVTVAKPGGPSVAVKIEGTDDQATITYGRHFDATMPLYSKVSRSWFSEAFPSLPYELDLPYPVIQISRGSIDLLKENFQDQMTRPDWELVIRLKKLFGIK